MIKVTNQWIYVSLDRNKSKLIDQQGFYLPANSNTEYHPYTLRALFDVPENDYRIQFCVTHGNSYPATVTNTVMTAELVDQE